MATTTYTRSITLQEGANALKFRATDEHSNIGTLDENVTYTLPIVNYTDMSGYAIGDAEAESDWSPLWVDPSSPNYWEFIADAGALGGQVLKDGYNSGQARALLFRAGTANAADAEVCGRLSYPDTITGHGLIVRAGGTTANKEGYLFFIRSNTRGRIYRASGSGILFLAETSGNNLTVSSGDFLDFRFRVNGSDLKLKYWKAGDAEPGAWDVETTDSTFSGAGDVGLFAQTAGSTATQQWDYFSYALNGDSARAPAAI